MPIKVLPARLANQIAAGEVVERPASVLKELLENSIDSGATQILIDVEKGGHKKIKVTDNGSGVVKDELVLALSRHATSKVSELDDLEHIATLGFRGEALASISSVSRLTLTSRPEGQTEAWQARCEGRDMQVIVEPAAHPQGTSVEVLDLFFNTPARRKFLRTEKTEFNHIEELFVRIALSRFDIALKLKHNGKLIKSLPAISSPEEHIKRIQQICGGNLCQDLLQLSSQYQHFALQGWVSKPGAFRSINDTQYVFVNNRMMRDKLILHAIRQAYEGLLPPDKYPFFVLYITLPHDEVDVNVHPAKHEVRFHQARLVHDFIYSGVCDALNAQFESDQDSDNVSPKSSEPRHNYQQENDYIKPLQPLQPSSSGYASGYARSTSGDSSAVRRDISEAASHYTQLVSSHYDIEKSTPELNEKHVIQNDSILPIPGKGFLIKRATEFYYLPQQQLVARHLATRYLTDTPASQPLLLPVSAKPSKLMDITVFCDNAAKLGMDVHSFSNKLILKQVPIGARKQRWQEIFVALLDGEDVSAEAIINTMARFWEPEPGALSTTLSEMLQVSEDKQALLACGAKQVPLQSWLGQLDE
ncbi:DNA mismatch repair endonuclease MutL [Planctobacterium marinum]|uniref:DNA mismatch repair protein MutL n=1 Tax=Planctobacterium marinum TaxID=1631968 RepID=A0AA48HG12_9ALTE|nr:hypothetical protein MACH26_01800 [Planctobacterium marinum]